MSRKKSFWLSVAMIHVALVGIGAFQVKMGTGLASKIAESWGRISGSTSGYAFFAPGVGSQLRAYFQIYDPAGVKVASVPLEQGKNKEADLRVGNIIGWFWRDNPERKTQRAMTASWAGKVFGRYPDAGSVEAVLESYYLPTMEEYRAGQRPRWEKYYSAKFTRRAQ